MAGQIERTWARGSPSVGLPSALGKLGAPGSDISSTGTTISKSSSLVRPASTISQSRLGPTRNRAIRSNGRCVAESPMRCTREAGGEPSEPPPPFSHEAAPPPPPPCPTPPHLPPQRPPPPPLSPTVALLRHS